MPGLRCHALDKFAGPVHSLPANLRGLVSQVLDHSLALIERGLHLFADTFVSMLIHNHVIDNDERVPELLYKGEKKKNYIC